MAARKTPLRAVKPDEMSAPVKPKSITEAADEGTSRDLLVALRTRLAKTLDDPNCPARDQASLSRRLLEIRREIEAMDAAATQEALEDAEGADDEALDASAF